MAELIKTIPTAPFVRILKEVLPEGLQINRNGKDSLMLASAIFALRLQAVANDICMESKRSTVNANDVLKAMEEVELPHLMDVLRNKLQAFRDKKAAARKKIRTITTTGDEGIPMPTVPVMDNNSTNNHDNHNYESNDEGNNTDNNGIDDEQGNNNDDDNFPDDDELANVINDALMEVGMSSSIIPSSSETNNPLDMTDNNDQENNE